MATTEYRPPRTEEDLEKVVESVRDVLLPCYRPATTPGEASEMLTTTELWHVLQERAPDLVQMNELRDVMVALGYVEHRIGTSMCWMLKVVGLSY